MSLHDLDLSIASLHQQFALTLTPHDLMQEIARRINEVNDDGIFITRCSEQQINEQIKHLPKKDFKAFPLWGIPFVVKDNIDVKGMPTTASCAQYSYVAKEHSVVVDRILKAGGILIGKTNLDQFATGLVGVRSFYPIPKNAINSDIIPGGSSSGSAVAVAHYLATFSLGTDTAGSGRIPAAVNNLIGLKPSLGMISTTGVVPACRSLDVVSIFSANIQDAYNVLEVTQFEDMDDPYSNAYPKMQANGINAPLDKTITIGIPDKDSIIFCDDHIQEKQFYKNVEEIKALGFNIIEIDFTLFYDAAKLLYEGAWVAERYIVLEDLIKNDPDALFPVTKSIVEQAHNFSAADCFSNQYKLRAIQKKSQEIFKMVDMLMVPSAPTYFTVEDLKDDPITPNSLLGTYTNFVNLLNLSALAVPSGIREDNLPASITLISKAGHDVLNGQVANIYLKQFGLAGGKNAFKHEAIESLIGEGELAIAACGAHMSGLPLNHQLLECGARLIKTTSTAKSYHLKQLTFEPPFRPGLIKTDKTGASIELEIWAMPKQFIGKFLAQVPAPLAIGWIDLISGESVQGFVCDAVNATQGKDVSSFKSWRRFISAAQ